MLGSRSITGFGQDGSYAHRSGYDFLLQGMGGLMSITGEQDHLPGGGPQKVGVALTDILTGMYAANAIQAKSSRFWLDSLEAASVPCGSINNIDQVFENPQVQHRQATLKLDHSFGNKIPSVANPIKYSKTPVEYKSAPPTLGQHTDSLLKEPLGYSSEKIKQLRKMKVV